MNSHQTLHCQVCHHVWSEDIACSTDSPVSEWATRIRSLRCPRCRGDYTMLTVIMSRSQVRVSEFVDGLVRGGGEAG